MTIDLLAGIRPKLALLATSLAPHTTIAAGEWQASAERAATSLEAYSAWLQKVLPTLPAQSAIGREKYTWFLQNIALMPYTPEELMARAEQEFRRSATLEALEANRNRTVPLRNFPGGPLTAYKRSSISVLLLLPMLFVVGLPSLMLA